MVMDLGSAKARRFGGEKWRRGRDSGGNEIGEWCLCRDLKPEGGEGAVVKRKEDSVKKRTMHDARHAHAPHSGVGSGVGGKTKNDGNGSRHQGRDRH